jgi:hypothetical protein
MSEEGYDDGLVHSHGWAHEPVPEGITRLVAPALQRTAAPEDITATAMNQLSEEERDDGLVHGHGWARHD